MKIAIMEFNLTTEKNPLMRDKISLADKSQTVSNRPNVLLSLKRTDVHQLHSI